MSNIHTFSDFEVDKIVGGLERVLRSCPNEPRRTRIVIMRTVVVIVINTGKRKGVCRERMQRGGRVLVELEGFVAGIGDDGMHKKRVDM